MELLERKKRQPEEPRAPRKAEYACEWCGSRFLVEETDLKWTLPKLEEYEDISNFDPPGHFWMPRRKWRCGQCGTTNRIDWLEFEIIAK